MNKYQEALDLLAIQTDKEIIYQDEINHYVNTLQELIDKATPTKPYYKEADEPLCPYCHNPLDGAEEHCEVCDQRIDWSSK